MDVKELRRVVDTYYDVQKIRIAIERRLDPRCLKQYTKKRVKRGGVKRPCPFDHPCEECEYYYVPDVPVLGELYEKVRNSELKLRKWLEEYAETIPAYREWLCKVKGVGPTLTCAIYAYMGGSTLRFPTVSKLWRYAGLAPDQTRRRRGKKIDWNPKLKTTLWKVVQSMIRKKSKYAEYYYKFRDEELKKGCTKLHARNRAIRKVAKLFLSHLWETERRMAGLPAGKSYVFEKLGHKHYIPPIYDIE